MAYRSHHMLGLAAAASLIGGGLAEPATAYLFWIPPSFAGAPVRGDEPGIGMPLPGATPAELTAHLLWNMRAGLNVAALQCQFSPPLMTVRNYNSLLSQHARELNDAYKAVSGYFKRTGGKTWQTQFDQYTTKTYNSFSTMHGQLGFCETAARIGREALERPHGQLYLTATSRMQEFRNSLVPSGDLLFQRRLTLAMAPLPSLEDRCWSKTELRKKCAPPVAPPAPAAPTASLPYTL